MRLRRVLVILCATWAIALGLPSGGRADGGGVDPGLFSGMHWRMIGPFRGGRAVAVAGVPGDGATFYFGAVGGGVWKTENAGRTWQPIMDSQPVASIGALAVAPSDSRTLYVGSGEADMRSDIIHGNGMYVSHDAGASWSRIGLDDSRQIGRILVDPRDAHTLLVAALGHAYGPNDVRGVYRSTDGGATWNRTLFLNADTGAIDLASDPSMRTVYASLWQTRRPPWSVYPPSRGPGTGLYVSHDAGVTWHQIKGNGFPAESLGKIGLAVSPSETRRVYAVLEAKAGGVYRSDDGGSTWRLMDGDGRLWQRCWYFCHITADPKNPDVVYVSDTSLYRSTDGGASFTAIKGSPDGDDFHELWIDPEAPGRMVLGSDQGVSVSIDGAKTWSSWFNQPTGQFYRVSADDQFPYHLYGTQQDSGALEIVARSDHSGIEDRDWQPLNAGGESGSIVPDPHAPGIVYGDFLSREETTSAQVRALAPTVGKPGPWRAEWTMPIAFGPDGALYTTRQVVFRSTDSGERWQQISADLARKNPGVPSNLDPSTAADADGPEPRGVVYSLAPSPLNARELWAGTDDGLIYISRDAGKDWRNVTPPQVGPWSHVDAIEASHFDPATAYVAVDRHRLEDDRPYVYETRDAGRSWRTIANGIPDGSFVWVVREDPVRRGLLYAGTETGVFISFDGGNAWQSLHLDMPVVPVHDIAVHGDDLGIATHGRALWVLDDVAPLRELAANAGGGARLFAPRIAYRTRPGNDQAEASPPEVPMGENPPNGAVIDYVVPSNARTAVTLELFDAHDHSVRRWSSNDAPVKLDPNDVDFPAYWLVPPLQLAGSPGMHRFVWDFHTGSPDGPWAPPGVYTVRLSVDGRTFSKPLELRRDPRVHASDHDLVDQALFAGVIEALQDRVRGALAEARAMRAQPEANSARIDALTGPPAVDGRQNSPTPPSPSGTLRSDAGLLAEIEDAVESADTAPTHTELAAWVALRPEVEHRLAQWEALRRGRR